MKLLLDENLPHELRNLLPGHDPFTVSYMGWNGIENGKLLALAAQAGFDALLTKDGAIYYQQNTANLPCAVVILEAASNSMKRIAPLIPELLRRLATMKPCTVTHVR